MRQHRRGRRQGGEAPDDFAQGPAGVADLAERELRRRETHPRIRARRIRGHQLAQRGLGGRELAHAELHEAKVVQRDEVRRVDVERRAIIGDGLLGLAADVAVVAAQRDESLEVGEARRVADRPHEHLVCPLAVDSRVAEDDAQLAVRHREGRVQPDGLLQEGDLTPDVATLVDHPRRFGVLAERLERRGRHLFERRIGPDLAQRLADLLAQALRQAVHGGDDLRRVGRRLTERDELVAGGRVDQPRRDEVRAACAHLANVSGDHRLDPVAERHFARQGGVQPHGCRALHPGERPAHLRLLHQRDHARLTEVGAKRLGDHVAE